MTTTYSAVDAVWRLESARLIASLTRVLGDVGLAEEVAQDALVVALEKWPVDGVPDNPAAWLTATAKHKAIDLLRRRASYAEKLQVVGRATPQETEIDVDLDDYVGDDLLRLVFVTCHPVLSQEARVALTLRLLGGLTTDEVARAFLTSEATVAQRIVRAKKTLAAKKVEFELPPPAEAAERLASVLEVVYLVFNEGYAATAGQVWTRPSLCEDALRLGRILVGLLPGDAEVHGLVALMELQASRTAARLSPTGDPVLLQDQDRRLWDRLLIRRGLAALEVADELGGGPYTLQAGIAACHARATTFEATDWVTIAQLYDALALVSPSPVVELNRAVAIGRAHGAVAALPIVVSLEAEGALAGYALLPAVHGDLLETLGRHEDARAQFEKAASLTRNDAERELFLKRARGGD
jgi:RNA polymerase sigma factor (sigma-70 family)